MTKRFSTLQAKLQELESILSDALLHGPETQSHHSLSKDIKQKIVFIGNLLSAEVASHPSKPHHLQHISQRLAKLEKAFEEWDTCRTFSYQGFDKDSTCSCTESCFNDDGEALDKAGGLDDFEEPEKLSPGFTGEKALVEFDGGVVEATGLADGEKKTGMVGVGFDKLASFVYEDAGEFFEDFAGDKQLVEFDVGLLRKGGSAEAEGKDKRNVGLERDELERQEREGAFGKKCCALAGGVVLGMVLMGFIMFKFSGCFHSVERVSFTIPT